MSEYRQKLKEYDIGAEAFAAIATAGTGIGLATGDSAAIGWGLYGYGVAAALDYTAESEHDDTRSFTRDILRKLGSKEEEEIL